MDELELMQPSESNGNTKGKIFSCHILDEFNKWGLLGHPCRIGQAKARLLFGEGFMHE